MSAPVHSPFLSSGFRPFFIGAGVQGTLFIVIWIVAYVFGWTPIPGMPGLIWHGHEMIFGYTSAVLAGFLLTAARNWTGLPTLHGHPLAALTLERLVVEVGTCPK